MLRTHVERHRQDVLPRLVRRLAYHERHDARPRTVATAHHQVYHRPAGYLLAGIERLALAALVHHTVLIRVFHECQSSHREAHAVELRHRLPHRQSCHIGQHGVIGIVGRDAHIHLAPALHHRTALGVLRQDEATLRVLPEDGVLHHKLKVYLVLGHRLGDILAHIVGHLVFLSLPGIDADKDEHHRQYRQRHAHHYQHMQHPGVSFQNVFLSHNVITI